MIKQELKKKKAELADRTKRMEVQKKYDLWQCSVNSKIYPVPAILEKEKMIRKQRLDEENAKFAFVPKVKGMLYGKTTTRLGDAEPIEIDLDEFAEQQKARAAEKADKDKSQDCSRRKRSSSTPALS